MFFIDIKHNTLNSYNLSLDGVEGHPFESFHQNKIFVFIIMNFNGYYYLFQKIKLSQDIECIRHF